MSERRGLLWARPGVLLVLLAVAFLLPTLTGSQGSTVQKLNFILSVTVLAIALNIAAGFAGQFLLGLGAVFAVAGYAAAIFANHHPHAGFAGMTVVAIVAGSLFGVLVGLPALRVGGFYLGVVTLFAAIMVPLVAQHADFAGAATGVALFANPDFSPALSDGQIYVFFVVIILIVALGAAALLHSQLGRRFLVLASSEELAASIGIPSYRTKMAAVVISSAVASLGGAMYVYSQQFFAPGSADVNLSILALAAAVIGGLGTISGPVVGSIVVFGLNTFLGFKQYTGIVFGALLLLFVLFAPRGVIYGGGELLKRIQLPDWRRRRQWSAEDLSAAATAVRSEPGEGSLVAEGVRRSFGGVKAVDGVDLVVARGTVHGLIGSNGSGKTTLLNLISGFYQADGGSISAGSVAVSAQRPYRRAQTGLARTFQTPKLMDRQTALANVIPGAELRTPCSSLASALRFPSGRRAARAAEQKALAALQAVGVADQAYQVVGSLPHGTRRLVELARAIATEPQFILVDEPAAGLSEGELETLSDSLRSLADAGIGVLLIEHNVPMVLSLASEVTALHQGRILFHGTPDALRDDPDVAMAFLGSFAGVEDSEEVIDHELI